VGHFFRLFTLVGCLLYVTLKIKHLIWDWASFSKKAAKYCHMDTLLPPSSSAASVITITSHVVNTLLSNLISRNLFILPYEIILTKKLHHWTHIMCRFPISNRRGNSNRNQLNHKNSLPTIRLLPPTLRSKKCERRDSDCRAARCRTNTQKSWDRNWVAGRDGRWDACWALTFR